MQSWSLPGGGTLGRAANHRCYSHAFARNASFALTLVGCCQTFCVPQNRHRHHHHRRHNHLYWHRYHQPKQFLSQLMSIVRSQPTPAACAAVYQTLRLLHTWSKAREILQLWDALPSFEECEAARSKSYATERAFSDAKMEAEEGVPKLTVCTTESATTDNADSAVVSREGDGDIAGDGATAGPPGPEGDGAIAGGRGDPDGNEAVDIYEPIFLYCKADAEASFAC